MCRCTSVRGVRAAQVSASPDRCRSVRLIVAVPVVAALPVVAAVPVVVAVIVARCWAALTGRIGQHSTAGLAVIAAARLAVA
jgi:hypothetical protein